MIKQYPNIYNTCQQDKVKEKKISITYYYSSIKSKIIRQILTFTLLFTYEVQKFNAFCTTVFIMHRSCFER